MTRSSVAREPAVWVGILASCIAAILQVLTGAEVISTASADAITNLVNSVGPVLTILVPLLGALVIRQRVTPTAAPQLPSGTIVDTPEGVTATVRPIVAPSGGAPG